MSTVKAPVQRAIGHFAKTICGKEQTPVVEACQIERRREAEEWFKQLPKNDKAHALFAQNLMQISAVLFGECSEKLGLTLGITLEQAPKVSACTRKRFEERPLLPMYDLGEDGQQRLILQRFPVFEHNPFELRWKDEDGYFYTWETLSNGNVAYTIRDKMGDLKTLMIYDAEGTVITEMQR